jgi:hypothetical protein
LSCYTIKKMERNTTLMEQHSREILETARKYDELYDKLINAVRV